MSTANNKGPKILRVYQKGWIHRCDYKEALSLSQFLGLGEEAAGRPTTQPMWEAERLGSWLVPGPDVGGGHCLRPADHHLQFGALQAVSLPSEPPGKPRSQRYGKRKFSGTQVLFFHKVAIRDLLHSQLTVLSWYKKRNNTLSPEKSIL